DIAAGAGLVVDDDRVAPFLRQFGAERPRQDIDAGPGRVRHDDRDRAAGVLALGRSERDCSQHRDGDRKTDLSHALSERAHNSTTDSVCSLPPCGGGVGGAVTTNPVLVAPPLPVPPPQGGREPGGASLRY